jgi:formate hydrogenlyase subunit 3/multisubunit Na+/H+ antiporter MnhD subunit
MPLLGTLLTTLFGAISAFLAKLFIAKLTIRVLGVAAIVSVGGVLMGVFNSTVSPLVAQMFNNPYGQFIGLAFPPISGTCIAAITTVWGACATYSLQVRAIRTTAEL